jgi:hypothetical protein
MPLAAIFLTAILGISDLRRYRTIPTTGGVRVLLITLGPARAADADDALGRSFVGYSPTMTDEEMHEANRGCWVLGQRADRENYALFSYQGMVVQAMEIREIVPAGARRALVGPILGPGHPVHDEYVGNPSPAQHRNPVHYFDAPEDRRGCSCGCGEQIQKGDFAPGHDQRAIHARIAKVGTVRDFLAWFDARFEEPS